MFLFLNWATHLTATSFLSFSRGVGRHREKTAPGTCRRTKFRVSLSSGSEGRSGSENDHSDMALAGGFLAADVEADAAMAAAEAANGRVLLLEQEWRRRLRPPPGKIRLLGNFEFRIFQFADFHLPDKKKIQYFYRIVVAREEQDSTRRICLDLRAGAAGCI